jgi:hypothetical protein
MILSAALASPPSLIVVLVLNRLHVHPDTVWLEIVCDGIFFLIYPVFLVGFIGLCAVAIKTGFWFTVGNWIEDLTSRPPKPPPG